MAQDARELINHAFRMIGAYRFNEAIPGDEIQGALQLLNELLASFSLKPRMIPYIETLTFPLVANQGVYTLGLQDGVDVVSRKIAKLVYAQYVMSGIEYPITILSKNLYNRMAILQSLPTLPSGVLLQNTTYTSVLTFYPQPDQAYDCIIKAKFQFDTLELDDRLDEIPDTHQRFFRYALADELAAEYSTELTPKQAATYEELKSAIQNSSDMDLTVSGGSNNQLVGAAAVRSGSIFQ